MKTCGAKSAEDMSSKPTVMKNLAQPPFRLLCAALCLAISLLPNHAEAVLSYWDPEGAWGSYATFTGGSLAGNWEDASWSRNSTGGSGAPADQGQSPPINFTESDAAVFAVGAGATNAGVAASTTAFTVTMNTNHSVAGFFIGSLGATHEHSCIVTIDGTGIITLPGSGTTLQGFNIANFSDSSVGQLTINNVIAGSAVLTPQGNGQIFLNGANTWTGGTQLGYSGASFNGIVNFNSSASFGTGSITISNTASGTGALVVEGTSAVTITNAVFSSQPTNAVGSSLNIVGNPAGVTFSGPWTLRTTKPTIIGSGGAANNLVIISGVISGVNSSSTFTKTNVGILELTAANTYTGATTVNYGILQLGDGVSLNGSVAAAITTTSPGILVFANPNAQTEAQVISGTGAVTKQAAGVLTLSKANTYSGLTTISAGTVKVGIANALPSGAGKGDVQLDGTLDMGGFSSGAGALNGAGSVDNSTGTATYTLTVAGNGDSGSFSGIIKNTSGTVALTKSGTGTQTLSGANAYSGLTTVSAGTLQVGVDNALPAASSVVVNGAGTLDMGGFSDTVAALGGAGSVINNNGTLTVNGNAATVATQNFNGFSCLAGTLGGSGTLVKGGTHAMAVRADNSSYGGPITFSGGTLSVGAAPNRLPTSLALSVPSGALFQLDANSQTISSLTGSGSVNLGGGTLTIAQNGLHSFNGVIQNSELAGSSAALGHGLRGYYYTNIDFTGLGTVRDDATVNLPDMSALPGYSPSAKTNQISVRWLGQVLTTLAGPYVFTTKCDDGQRLWVNGTLLVDDWATHGATAKSGTNTLAANTRYDIVMEYFNNAAGGSAQLSWTPPGDSASVVIPGSNLLLPGAGTLVKSGTGTQVLEAASTYSGGTTVSAGALEASVGGALGSGNVTVADGATLTLDASSCIASAADLVADSATTAVELRYIGTNSIHALSLDGGNTHQPAGTYGSLSSTASHKFNLFTGPGILNVTANPSTNVLTSTASPAVYGSSVNLTSTITGSGATPTGSVNFYDNNGTSTVLLGSAALNGSGVATFSINNLMVGVSHSLFSVYSGDSTHAASTSGTVSVSTTVATLVPTAVIATKIYDGATTATIASLGGMLDSDSNYVHAASYTANFADKDVGVGKSVSISSLVLGGSLSGNYTLSTTSLSASGNITNKFLTVSGIIASNKIYDATTTATINTTAAALPAAEAVGSGTTADGKPYTGDAVSLVTSGATGTFADANVGTNKTVTINGLTLSGAQASDYAVTPPTTNASITKASSQDNFTSSPNPSSPGANVTFTATLSAVFPGAGTPTGSVIFATNGVPMSTNALVSGVASTSTTALPVGTTPCLAWYTGDGNFSGVTNSLSQVVNSTCSQTNRILSIIPNGGNSFTLNLVGTYQAQYYILSQTNASQPLANWLPVPGSTNTVSNPSGLWSVNVTNRAPAFYRSKAINACP